MFLQILYKKNILLILHNLLIYFKMFSLNNFPKRNKLKFLIVVSILCHHFPKINKPILLSNDKKVIAYLNYYIVLHFLNFDNKIHFLSTPNQASFNPDDLVKLVLLHIFSTHVITTHCDVMGQKSCYSHQLTIINNIML